MVSFRRNLLTWLELSAAAAAATTSIHPSTTLYRWRLHYDRSSGAGPEQE